MEPYFEDAVHALKGLPNVVDIRNFGLVAAVEMQPRAGKPGNRGMSVFHRCFDAGVLTRCTADTIALSPPLIVEKHHVDRIFETLSEAILAEAA